MYQEKVLKEYGEIAGRYRVRLIQRKNKPVIDIREYIETDEYTGFTRKGIALTEEELDELVVLIKGVERKDETV